MKKELIAALFQQFEQACQVYNNIECWSARELQGILGYSEWRNFAKVIDKEKSCLCKCREKLSNHFVDINKMVETGSGAERKLEDIALTRYACYLVAQNGDAAKQAIAFAQTYFAVQTRRQEIIEQRLQIFNVRLLSFCQLFGYPNFFYKRLCCIGFFYKKRLLSVFTSFVV